MMIPPRVLAFGLLEFWTNGVAVHKSGRGKALVTQFQGDKINCCVVDDAVLEVEGVDPCKTTYECPTEFGMHGDHCYAFSTYSAYWNDAKDACKDLNPDAHLVRPTTKEIDDYIISQVSNTKENFWNDVNCIDNDRKFTYTNGKELSYTNWGGGEPNEGGTYCVYNCDEDCSQYYYKKSHRWNDENCDNKARFVCQMDRMPVYTDYEPEYTDDGAFTDYEAVL